MSVYLCTAKLFFLEEVGVTQSSGYLMIRTEAEHKLVLSHSQQQSDGEQAN